MRKFYSFIAMMLLSALSFTANAATAEVYIDNPNAVAFYVYYGGGWDITPLSNSGDTPNVIEFDEAKCKLFEFDPQGSSKIYKITKNGADIDLSSCWNGEGYELAGMKDGDVLRVVTERPAISGITVTFEKGAEAIESVEINDEIVPVIDNAFTAQMGDRVVLRPNSEYKISRVTLNGEAVQYIPASGCYFFEIKSETNVLSVEIGDPVAEGKTIKLNTNDMNALKFYTSDFYMFLGDPVEVTGNEVVVSPKASCLQFMAGNDYKVVSATYTTASGATKDMEYSSWYNFYYVEDVFKEDVVALNIVTEEKVIENINVTVWVEDVTKLSYYFIRTKDRKFLFHSEDAPLFQTGDNTLTITTEQTPIRLYFECVGEPINEVYLNDVKVTAMELDPADNSIMGDFPVADGDVLKIYTNPETVTGITFATQRVNAGKVYNLQGVEMSGKNLPAGLYIVNGKKIMVK